MDILHENRKENGKGGLQEPTSGEYTLYGRKHSDWDIRKSRRRMGAVVETPSIRNSKDLIVPHFKANSPDRFNIIFPARLPQLFPQITYVHFQRALQEALTKEGYDICRAYSGTEALYVLKSGNTPPDLILLDLMLPGLDVRLVMFYDWFCVM